MHDPAAIRKILAHLGAPRRGEPRSLPAGFTTREDQLPGSISVPSVATAAPGVVRSTRRSPGPHDAGRRDEVLALVVARAGALALPAVFAYDLHARRGAALPALRLRRGHVAAGAALPRE